MSGTTSNKKTGTTKASSRYDEASDTINSSVHRTASQLNEQSADRTNPVSELESVTTREDQQSVPRHHLAPNNYFLQRSPDKLTPGQASDYSARSTLNEQADFNQFGVPLAANLNSAEQNQQDIDLF